MDVEREEKQEVIHLRDSWVPQLPIKSIVLDYCGRKKIDTLLAMYIYDILRGNALNMQCFWTPIWYREDYCTMDFNLINMLTRVLIRFKQFFKNICIDFKIENLLKQEDICNEDHSGYPDISAMESITWNNYMLRSFFKKSETKQIECGFWREVSYMCPNIWNFVGSCMITVFVLFFYVEFFCVLSRTSSFGKATVKQKLI